MRRWPVGRATASAADQAAFTAEVARHGALRAFPSGVLPLCHDETAARDVICHGSPEQAVPVPVRSSRCPEHEQHVDEEGAGDPGIEE